MKIFRFAMCALHLGFSSLIANAASDSPVIRLDASLDAVVGSDARLETIVERETIFEGPTWIKNGTTGYLIFSDVPGNAIGKWLPDGTVSELESNIFSGKNRSEAYQSFGLFGQKKFPMLGPNGITLDAQGRIVFCALSDGLIVRLENDGSRTVLASRFGENRLNAPNDLVYKSDGSLYFTDSRAGTRRADSEGVPHKGLYVLREGNVQLLGKDIDLPNGLAFSPDEKYLYVGNSLRKHILRFDVQPNGLANERVFIDMDGDKSVGLPDGLKVDESGNVYSSGPGGIWIISPGGKHIGTITTPKPLTNLAFGGKDYKTLYMTGYGALYRIQLKLAASRSCENCERR